jgi:protein-tyrosine-phosphatase
MQTVLFVCAANQCRSPMAMALFKDLVKNESEEWQIASAGILARSNYPATDHAIQAMSKLGLSLDEHGSQPVTEALLDMYNLILCMENDQVSFIKQNFPNSKQKVFLLSEMVGNSIEIYDPVGLSLHMYSKTALEIRSILEDGLKKIKGLSSDSA